MPASREYTVEELLGGVRDHRQAGQPETVASPPTDPDDRWLDHAGKAIKIGAPLGALPFAAATALYQAIRDSGVQIEALVGLAGLGGIFGSVTAIVWSRRQRPT